MSRGLRRGAKGSEMWSGDGLHSCRNQGIRHCPILNYRVTLVLAGSGAARGVAKDVRHCTHAREVERYTCPSLNRIFLLGALTRPPTFRQTTHGTPICSVDLASTCRPSRAAAPFASLIFGQRAAPVARHLRRGGEVLVAGHLRQTECLAWRRQGGSAIRRHRGGWNSSRRDGYPLLMVGRTSDGP